MKAFRVIMDGKAMGDFGVADFANASVIVGFGRVSGAEHVSYRFHVGGLTQSDANGVSWHFRWHSEAFRKARESKLRS
jgi:hypothetical protein